VFVLDPLDVVALDVVDGVDVVVVDAVVDPVPARPGSLPEATWLKITPKGPMNAATATTATVLRIRFVR
jgi:hypothetical protein